MINILITYFSLINGVNSTIAFSVARVESGMNPEALSRTGDGGLFQLNNKAYRFHNESWRYNVLTNTAIALDFLGRLKETCKHKMQNSYVVCYNLGLKGASKIRNPLKQTYYKKVTIPWRI